MVTRGSHDEPTPPHDEPRAYGAPVDAIVLSGTHQNARRLIHGRNKAFLEIEGRPLVRHVVDALEGARHIGRIYVVGPRDELETALDGCPGVVCVPQEGKLLSNGWAAVRAMEAEHGDLAPEALRERPLLLLSCDLPLVTAGAVDDFVERAARLDRERPESNAMIVGIAEDEGLRPFYGDSERPGVRRPLVQMSEGLFRLSNIYVARPRKLEHSEFIQTSFNLRKAKDWHNVAKLVFSLFSQHGGWFAAWMTCRLQLAALLRRGQGRMYQRLRRGNTFPKIEKGVSAVLGGPVRLAVSPYGGLSLDVDEEEDYVLLRDRYREWMAVSEALDRQRMSTRDSDGQNVMISTDSSSQKKNGSVEK